MDVLLLLLCMFQCRSKCIWNAYVCLVFFLCTRGSCVFFFVFWFSNTFTRHLVSNTQTKCHFIATALKLGILTGICSDHQKVGNLRIVSRFHETPGNVSRLTFAFPKMAVAQRPRCLRLHWQSTTTSGTKSTGHEPLGSKFGEGKIFAISLGLWSHNLCEILTGSKWRQYTEKKTVLTLRNIPVVLQFVRNYWPSLNTRKQTSNTELTTCSVMSHLLMIWTENHTGQKWVGGKRKTEVHALLVSTQKMLQELFHSSTEVTLSLQPVSSHKTIVRQVKTSVLNRHAATYWTLSKPYHTEVLFPQDQTTH